MGRAKRDDLINYIGQYKSVGDNLNLTVYRNGHAIDLKATLSTRPSLLPFLLSIWMAPMFAGLAMATSSVTVVENSILLARYRPRFANKKPKRDELHTDEDFRRASLQATAR